MTPNNQHRRILLDGEPVPTAFAASERKGWVKAYIGYETDCRVELLTGFVQIVGGDRPMACRDCEEYPEPSHLDGPARGRKCPDAPSPTTK